MSYETLTAGAFRDDSAAVAAATFNGATTVAYPSHATLGLAAGNDFTAGVEASVTFNGGIHTLVEAGGSGHGWALYVDNTTLYGVWTNNNVVESVSHSLAGMSGQSFRASLSISGQQMSLHLDGVRVDTATHGTTYTTSGGDGGAFGGINGTARRSTGDIIGGSNLTGAITEAYTWDGALTDAEGQAYTSGPQSASTVNPWTHNHPLSKYLDPLARK